MKPIILIFTAFYLPGYRGGGPIQSIANMVDCLSDDFDFRIVTSDRDLGDKISYPNIKMDEWNLVGKAMVFYMSPQLRSFSCILRCMRKTPHDLIYCNSFFGKQFTIFPLLARWLGLVAKRPLIIAPRGEFSKGALNIKTWKKRLYIYIARLGRLFYDAHWHASTEIESFDIKNALSVSAECVHVALNIVAASEFFPASAQLSDAQVGCNRTPVRHLRVCFLSRISPKKNLDFALNILMQVKAPVEFRIFGPKEDIAYWGKCQNLIANLPANIKAVYCGSIEHSQVRKIISDHDIFFVPTRGENFGHVFIESFSAGVPVLVSDQTPWRDLEDQGIGWDISLNQPEKFVKTIEVAAQLCDAVRHQMKLNCLNFSQKRAEAPSTLVANRALFLRALAAV